MTNTDGATAIEHTLIAFAAITTMGKAVGKISNVLTHVSDAMT